jgi:hypothetical protein
LPPIVRTPIHALALFAGLAGRAEAAQFSVYPSPHAHFAAPKSQISFRGGTPAQIGSISVTGSRSGRHTGKLLAHSDGQGASFIPSKAFTPGERVIVRTHDHIVGAHDGDYGFTIGVPGPEPKPTFFHVQQGKLQSFASRPDLKPPAVVIKTRNPGLAPGLIFAAPKGGSADAGPMIFDDTGHLVWYHPIKGPDIAMDFRAQTYQGRPVLTWWQGHVYLGDGTGHGEIWDSAYRQVATVNAADGLSFDLHEFTITPHDTALITVYQRDRLDLRAYGGPKDGVVVDGIVQEIDIKTGLLLFEWHSLDHVPLTDSYVPAKAGPQWDYFHINGLDEDRDGNIIVSSRNAWSITKVSRATGNTIWRLGGKRSTFKLGPGVQTAWQHNPHILPDGTLTIFDNANGGVGKPFRTESRAETVRLDTASRTATLVSAFTSPEKLSASSQGDVQRLANGDDFVGWGAFPNFTEYSPTGQVLLDGRLSVDNASYRTFRFLWSGRPAVPPRAVASKSGSSVRVSGSWNGATDVASWQLLAGPGTEGMLPVASARRHGFETAITAAVTQPFVAMRALDAAGNILGTSAPVKVP